MALLLFILIMGLAFFFLKPGHEAEIKKPQAQRGGPCPGEVVELAMPDPLMDGLLKKDQKFRVTINWYACHSIERGDLVYYQYSSSLDPVVKVVRAIPDDKFEVTRDKKAGAWNLTVNGELLMDEASQTPYYFGAKPTAVLSLYEKANDGVLKDNDVILLSNVPPGGNDSGLFGVANVDDIVGKVEVISE